MDIPLWGLISNEASDDELWRHGLRFQDADDVWAGPAKYFNQAERLRADEDNWLHRQPRRLKMIGPNASGRLLTLILELPNADGYSHVVTGWPSSAGDRSRYNQRGGRMRSP